jgi:hypothetical protein
MVRVGVVSLDQYVYATIIVGLDNRVRRREHQTVR